MFENSSFLYHDYHTVITVNFQLYHIWIFALLPNLNSKEYMLGKQHYFASVVIIIKLFRTILLSLITLYDQFTFELYSKIYPKTSILLTSPKINNSRA